MLLSSLRDLLKFWALYWILERSHALAMSNSSACGWIYEEA